MPSVLNATYIYVMWETQRSKSTRRRWTGQFYKLNSINIIIIRPLPPWRGGKCLTWDVKVVNTFTQSYLSLPSTSTGVRGQNAKIKRHCHIRNVIFGYDIVEQTSLFYPLAWETVSPVNGQGASCLDDIGRHHSSTKGWIHSFTISAHFAHYYISAFRVLFSTANSAMHLLFQLSLSLIV